MKKVLKSMLAVLLAVLMAFGVYLPMSGVALFDSFYVEASAASVTSTTTGKFVIFLPAGVKMYSCSSVTGSTNSTPYFHSSSEQLTIYATEKCVLSNGSIRFLITANTASGVRTLYYQLPSSATAYQLPNPPDSINYSGKMCNNQHCVLEWVTASYVDFYIVEVYDSRGNYVHGSYSYPSSSGKSMCELDFSDRVVYGSISSETFSVSITPVREIGTGWYYGNEASCNVKYGSCQSFYTHGIYGINYDANGGYGGPSTQNWSNPCSGYTTLTSSVPTRDGYTFLGWSTSSTATQPTYYPSSSVYFDHNQLWLYAVWSKTPTYTVSYNANGGSGAPAAQTKNQDATLWLSSTKPTKSYTVTYNANGGSVTPSNKNVSCTFKNWNTAQNGNGTSYSSGASYTANSGATLYAQWTNPTYGTLPTPTKTGYIFDGWYTSASGGTKVTSSSTVLSNTTLYAHWSKISETDIYNLAEETYSFKNMGLKDDYYKCEAGAKGHCFGMSVTSSGYYMGELDISTIGATKEQELYDLSLTPAVQYPICEYQALQGPNREKSTVAGGSWYLNDYYDTYSDWNEVVNYVKNHKYDNIGTLQIGLRSEIGGHAVNFLRYEEIDGQSRIYIYDNNYPDIETYLYMDSSGLVRQAPRTLFYNGIKCVALRSMSKYFEIVKDADKTRYLYAEKDSIIIDCAVEYEMECAVGETQYIMFVVPDSATEVTITPLVDNAEFTYLDESYSFGSINDDTVGLFTLVSSDDEGGASSPGFTIENESKSIWDIISDFFMMIIELLFGWLF